MRRCIRTVRRISEQILISLNKHILDTLGIPNLLSVIIMTRPLKESRTAKSIKNSTVALIFFSVDFVLKFFSRSIFIKILGDEVLGLNSTMMNLLQFLNLAELGIGAAVGFTLYKPIADNDTETINEILHLNGHLYKRIAVMVSLGALIIMCFFPIIFKKIELPLWYTYVTFSVFLIGLVLNYSMNYKQILLSACQMDYKIQYSYKSCQIIKVIVQIVAVELLPQPYMWWLGIECAFSFISAIVLNNEVRHTFPYIGRCGLSYKELRSKYESILKKIKQVFFHKISGFILTQTSPLIIYAYLSLTVVTLYTNYILITTGITQLFNAIFNSMTNAIGNLVAENNRERILTVFYEIFSIRFYIASLCSVGMLCLSKPFVNLWLGQDYILPNTTLYIIIALLFINLTRTTVDAFLNAYGMFQDIVAPIIEAVTNLGLAILLGHFWGLNGILTGTLISLIIIILIWKPYFLFTKGFKKSIFLYVKSYLKHVVVLIISYLFSTLIWSKFGDLDEVNNLWEFIRVSIFNLAPFVFIFTGMMILCRMPILKTVKRFIK